MNGRRDWLMSMRWHHLLFMHWPIAPQVLRPLLPRRLELDTFDGQGWIGIVPFTMSQVRPRFVPPLPRLSAFPELNVRTYVTLGGCPGVWFFSLDAANPLAVRVARRTFHLPYFDAKMSAESMNGQMQYRSERTHRHAPPAEFSAHYRPNGPVFSSRPGTLEDFLTHRLCLYSANRRGDLFRGDIHHTPWPLQCAEAEIKRNSMTDGIAVSLPPVAPLLHYAERLDVVAWRIRVA